MPRRIDLEQWNDAMYLAHPTPYFNRIAGIIEQSRLKDVAAFASVATDDSLIELGCEQGILLASLPKSRRMVGVDISNVALTDARRRLGRRVELIQADVEKPLNVVKEKFDVVICSQLLEHVADPKAVMENIKKLAKDEARVVISVPNELFMLRMKRFLRRLGFLQLLFPGIEEGVSEWHLQVFTQRKVERLLRKDFMICQTRHPFNVYLVYLLKKFRASTEES